MNVALWIVAALLAIAFAAAGAMKTSQPKAKLKESGQGWVDDFSASMVKAIGALEVTAAVGLILPPLLGIAPWLAPLAATGLVLMMVGAAITHFRRGELPNIAVNVVLGALALFVAWGRFGPSAF